MAPPSRKLEVLAVLPMPDIAKVTRRGKTGTVEDVMGKIDLNGPGIRRYLRQLYADGLAHIGCWNRSSYGFIPVWVKGNGKHVPEPRPLSQAENSRRYRARVRKALERSQRGFKYDERYEGKVALAKAEEVAQRTRIAPQHWFSPLGL